MMKRFVTRDTILFPIPSGLMVYDGFEKLGWETHYVPLLSEGGHMLADYDYGGPVDILFDYTNILSNPNHANELKAFKEQNPNCIVYVAAYLPYDHNHTTELDNRFHSYHGLVDHFFNSTIQHKKAFNNFSELGFSYLSIPYPSIIDQPPTATMPAIYDTSFIGTVDSGERLLRTWYPEITKPELRTYLAGFNGRPGIVFEDMLSISMQTKVNLNPHYLDQIGEDEDNIHSRIDFNTRVFHLAALGCFQLTNHPTFKLVFGNNCPIFDKQNFKDMLHFFLNNDEERLKVAHNMQQVALEKHTSKIYAQKISQNNFNFL